MSQQPFFNLIDLLAVENDPDLLAFNCPTTDIPAWAFIRLAFIRTIIGKVFYERPIMGANFTQRGYPRKARYLIRSLWHNVTSQPKQAQVCFLTTGLGNYAELDCTRDRLASSLAEASPKQSLIFQGHGNWTWPKNFAPTNTLYNTPSKVRAHALGWCRTSKQHRDLALTVIAMAALRARTIIGFDLSDEEVNTLAAMLSHRLATYPQIVDYYYRWFLKREIRLLMLEDGCLGSNMIGVIQAARMAKVVTAEYQHGMISSGHDGYNIGDHVIAHTGFRQTLPHYMLTYGKWWNAQFNMPVAKIAVGNPHFAESLKRTYEPADKSDILILGDGFDTQSYISLANDIRNNSEIGAKRVLFRPHPIERERLQSINLPQGVEIDSNPNIYHTLSRSLFVISELSTGLFEAAAMGCKPLMWSTPKSRFALPDPPFPSFLSFNELGSILATAQNQKHSNSVQYTEFFELDWISNFTKFVEEVLEIDYRDR
ncbi:hypothetical protein [Sphingorhabdus contaminans]|uniref:Uncharacterized protein n=1 Tax=Sphingorhabdus contaminans TaxID=1343899 RepID=A0A553WBG4_9SPHN|nr:hypothetical protein [Sphingorhabdus contaminans]TSB02038.1 hypothetical protein FOM92_12950 [Sphingorhabdus contaminans]